jgi:hypothetical protein
VAIVDWCDAPAAVRQGVPMGNNLAFCEQLQLTREKCLYNDRRVGEYLSL